MIQLYALAPSPFVNKVAAILDFKHLPYEPVFIHPLRRQEIQFSKHKKVPILDDGGTVVEDSAEIALYLEGKVPSPPILPADPAARQAVLDLERWIADEMVPGYYGAALFGVRSDRMKSLDLVARTSPLGWTERTFLPLVSGFVLRDRIRRSREKLPHLGQWIDAFEGHLGQGPFLGEQPAATLADLSAYGFLSVIVDLDMSQADALLGRPAIRSWIDRMRPLTSGGRRLLDRAR